MDNQVKHNHQNLTQLDKTIQKQLDEILRKVSELQSEVKEIKRHFKPLIH